MYFKNDRKISNEAKKVRDILVKEKVNFEIEKTFSNLKGKKSAPLRYDFAIYDENNNLKYLIEYDSNLHFKYTPYIHKSTTNFRAAQERDRRKNSYCLANNILLYRIPYWEIKNIHTLKDILKDDFLVKSKWHNDNIRRKNV